MRHDVSNGEVGRWALAARSQSGSILLLVLGIVMMLSVAVVAVLNMSLSSDQVANSLETSTKSTHSVDGALEDAVNDVRIVDDACDSTETYGAYEVECVLVNVDPGPPVERIMTLTATSGANVVGRAQIKVTDGVNGKTIIGHTAEVCDWLLARSLSEQMNGCSVTP